MVSIENSLFSEPIDLLDKLLAASTDHIYVFDRTGRYMYASPAGLAALGLQATEMLGKTWHELNFPADIMERHDAQRESVFQTGIPVKGETSFPTVDGVRYYEYVLSPILGEAGTVDAVIDTVRDITERRQAEDALRLLNKELEARVVARTEELTAVNASLRSQLVERQRAEQALQESEMRFHALVDAMFEGVVIQENGRIIEANPGFAKMFGYSLEEVIGKSAVEFLTPESLETMRQHIENQHELPYEMRGIKKDGTFIDLEVVGKQSLYQGRSVRVSAARDITARKQAEIALREKEQQLQQLSDSMPQFVWISNAQGETEYVNRQWLEYSGLTVKQSCDAQKATEFLHPEEAQSISERWAIAQATQQPFEVEARLKRASDGVYRWFLIRSVPALDERGQVVRWYGTSTDIHDRKEATERLRLSEERFQRLVANVPGAIYQYVVHSDGSDGLTYISPQCREIYEYEPEVLQKDFSLAWKIVHPEDVERVNAVVAASAENLEPLNVEFRLLPASGKLRWVQTSSTPTRLTNGDTTWDGIVTDITDRKQTEQALQEREAVLRLFVQNAPAGIAMFDREMHFLIGSQRWADDYYQGMMESMIGRSHYDLFPDLPERWRQIHQRCLVGAIEKCDEDLFVRADGCQQWIRWETRPWYTATDEIGGIIIFAEDITQRKQAETAILQLNQELQQKVTELQILLDVIPIGIGIAEDPECQQIRVNPAFAVALGIPHTVNASLSAPEAERPTNFKVYQNGREMAPEELPLQYAASHGVEIRDLEVEVVWQDGTTVTLLEYAAPLVDESGQPRGSVGAFLNITERKQAEAELRRREELYRALAHNFPNGAVHIFDHDLRYLVSDGTEMRKVGLSREQLEGYLLWEVVPPETSAFLEPLYQAALAGETTSAELSFANQIYQIYTLPLRNEEGEIFAGLSMSQNITLLKQAEQTLRTARDELERQVQERTRELQEANTLLAQREREFRTLVENTPDVITRHDRQHRYLYINPASTRVAGISPELYLGKKPSELGYPENITRFWEASLESVFTTGEMRIDEFTVTDMDEPRSYQVYVVPERDEDRTITSVMTIARDVTRLRQAEESARRMADELQRSNQELEQFAYVASHDLQEPLRAITSFTQLLAKRYRGHLDAKADTYIEFVVDGATRMQQLIRDLLTYSRVGRYELKLQLVDCNALIERVKKDLQVTIAETQAVINSEPLPTVTADRNQLGNLLQNLISNSLKYRSEIPPRIYISAKRNLLKSEGISLAEPLSSSVAHAQEEWVFSIQDNGIGMEPQYAEQVFGIFQRLHSSSEYPGTGLGLAICKKIIERHGGRIWVESHLGEGATFFFTIPISHKTQ